MNVLKVYLMQFFSVLNMTTQDSNAEISKLLFFSEYHQFKNLSQEGLGFCAAIKMLTCGSQFKEMECVGGGALCRPTH